ncbi:uncharacterized protein LOC130644445 [Hydractinia symbiolongicarpus]|uniref:uncharacterized protein LOC130644445 n=1 Tax=Hydractinia symbiolongicarpus TaxID=13093 RepID=UPI00254FDF57|nr:uncharacterized protein LOC130644445 [Hydractinia symbiolongicarpus]
MWATVRDSSKGFLNRVTGAGTDAYGKVNEFFFGVNVGDEVELQSVRSFKSTRSPGSIRKVVIPEQFENTQYSEYEGIDTSRNLVVSSSTLFRKGPVPIEFLSNKEQNRLSRRGCLKEWDDLHQSTSDNQLGFEDPSSKSLLSYFARLGTGEDDKDAVNLAFVDSLLKVGATFNYPDVYGQSIFFAVVRDWHIDVAYFAIQRGADVNHRDKFGRTPLHLAAAANYPEMVEFLLENNAIINSKTNGEEQTPLHYAARYDSVEAMKVLIQAGAMIDEVDFIQRTPLQVAAEIGARESVKFLLKLGAPAGVYDIFGNSAVFLMVEKMPQLAYEGLNQFFVEDNAMRRRYYYLDHLEFDVKARGGQKDSRSVLQAIVMYNELDLIMHPAIQKLLDVKWSLFGKTQAIINNFWNIFYAVLATVLTYTLPFSAYDRQFTPVKDKAWKIVLAVIFFILTFYFWIKQILFVRRSSQRDNAYKEQRLLCVRKQKPYCHPRWEEEREYYNEEVQRIQHYKSAFWQDSWNIFEWVSLVFVLIMFALHIVNVIEPNRDTFKAAKLISAISLLLVWFRLYKTLRVIGMFSELTVLLGHVISETCKFLLLYMVFYIPYVFLFYMLFGGSNEDADVTKFKEDHALESLSDVAYYVWILAVKGKYPKDPLNSVNHHVGQVVVGSYFAMVAVLLLYIYIGRISEVFCRLHKNANANANLLIASLAINEEQELSISKTKQLRKYMRNSCGPMVVPFDGNKVGDDGQNINIGIEHITTKVEEITNFLGKAAFSKEEKQPVGTDHLTLIHTELEKLSQRQVELDAEVEATKTKIGASQKRTIDMIKESIESRTNKGVRRRPRRPLQPKSGYTTE